ncbi:MAG: hypothetical protein A2W19_02340 [Spirochaetes bacterium RBG_16_49_21]|nr:MAG: hypothetical protein A2W19_02340 [Spirochaetes bacterium RBG_16_49_21]
MKTKKTTSAEESKGKIRRFEAPVEFPGYGEEIRLQAYYNFLDRMKNNMPGNETSDWLEAEKMVRSKIKAS